MNTCHSITNFDREFLFFFFYIYIYSSDRNLNNKNSMETESDTNKSDIGSKNMQDNVDYEHTRHAYRIG